MNFDDRLRDHLTEQNEQLDMTPTGVDSVHARSAKRKQQRATAGGLAIAAFVVAIGAFVFNQTSGSATDFATEGVVEEATTTTLSDDAGVAAPGEIERALPEPGSSLDLSPANNDNAPGGYNAFNAGRAGDVYYVISTAPGVTYENSENFDETALRQNTIYAFDGSSWTNTSVNDRFVSGLDSSQQGVLYAVSTGTEAGYALSVGTSSNAGSDWAWTDIDLTEVFGADESQWPPFTVTQAVNGSERLLVVRSIQDFPVDRALEFANSGGLDIADANQVLFADSAGITYFPNDAGDSATDDIAQDAAGDVNPECAATAFEVAERLWDEADEVLNEPVFASEIIGEPTPEQLEAVDAYQEEVDAFYKRVDTESLAAAAAIAGCEMFVECTAEFTSRQGAISDAHEALLQENRGTPESNAPFTQEEYEELSAKIGEQLDQLYEESEREMSEWAESSGCEAQLGVFSDGFGEHANDTEFASWEDLGVTLPDDVAPISATILVTEGSVDVLDTPFDSSGFVANVGFSGTEWQVLVDLGTYQEEEDRFGPSIVRWSTVDGVTWASEELPGYPAFSDQTGVAGNGTSYAILYEEESAVLRTNPDGSTQQLKLADLAPEFDNGQYSLMNVSAGEYGVVAWAVAWPETSETYETIVLYSPDGISWGVTELPGVEVVNAAVGSDDVLIFLNDPNREEGTPQPILIGR